MRISLSCEAVLLFWSVQYTNKAFMELEVTRKSLTFPENIN